ncbi:MAG: aminotransferase class IV [Desulfovibrio sp.]|nr:aminotransferase class IV [Desulfovibrio sp.]
MDVLDWQAYTNALLAAKRPGAENYLAFYDHRIKAIGTNPAHLLIPLDDHLCHRGDGLFESICFRKGRIYVLDAHIARMQQGAKALEILPPCSWEEIQHITCQVAQAAKVPDGDLRIFLSRGPGGFGISPTECPEAGLYIVAIRAKPIDPAIYTKGITAFTSTIPPKQNYLATIKNTNYLPNVFMAMEATKRGLDVAVSFDADGCMGEAAVANIALVAKDDTFVCPDFTNILPGTTLLSAMRLVPKKMPLIQRPITHKDIYDAKEVLLLTSSSLCVPVTSFDNQPIAQGKPGPVAAWLKEELAKTYDATGIVLGSIQ